MEESQFKIIQDGEGFAITYCNKIIFVSTKLTEKYIYMTYIKDDSLPADEIQHQDFKVGVSRISDFLTDISKQVQSGISINNLKITKKSYV